MMQFNISSDRYDIVDPPVAESTNAFVHANFVKYFLSCPWDKPAIATQSSCGAFGSAVEAVLNMKANNNIEADWVCSITGSLTEVKSHDLGLSFAPTTLFTKKPTRWFDEDGNVMLTKKGKPKAGANSHFWSCYSYVGEEDDKRRLMMDLYINSAQSMDHKLPNGQLTKAPSMATGQRHLFSLSNDGLTMGMSIDQKRRCEWDYSELNSHTVGKVSQNMAYISGRADANGTYRITHLTMHDTPANFEKMLKAGNVTTALRMSQKANGACHDRGTAFRIDRPSSYYSNSYDIIVDGQITEIGRALNAA